MQVWKLPPETPRCSHRKNLSSWKKRLDREPKEEMTRSDIQSVLRLSKLLDVSNGLKIYHLAIVDQLNGEEEAESEERVLDDHELKVTN